MSMQTCTHHAEIHVEALERRLEVDLENGLLLRLGDGQVAEEDGRVECEGVHVLGARRVDLVSRTSQITSVKMV